MIFTETHIVGAYLIDLERVEDSRGFFARIWCEKEFESHGIAPCVAQANLSYNHLRGTIRGLHYQLPPHGEAKLARCTSGAVYDVIVDMREDSSTYLAWFGVELSTANRRMLYAPAGCAHGYQTLCDNSEVVYQVSQFYMPGVERGIRWDDPIFGIRWPIPAQVVSAKDSSWPDHPG